MAAACDMEHAVDSAVVRRFACFLEHLGRNVPADDSWLADFRETWQDDPELGICTTCSGECMSASVAEREK